MAKSDQEPTSKGRMNRHRDRDSGPKLRLVQTKETSAVLSWKSSDPCLNFQIQYINCNRLQSWAECCSLRVVEGELTYRLEVSNLSPGQTYLFRLQAFEGEERKGRPGPEVAVDTQGACCFLNISGMGCGFKLTMFEAGFNKSESITHLQDSSDISDAPPGVSRNNSTRKEEEDGWLLEHL
mmetsp:Transcript_52160/g.76298  ORF Transcript_52160/g.76298 Transcript_52160/m.76298 type:complete len:181 (-) Transcript_52160:229-771(-)